MNIQKKMDKYILEQFVDSYDMVFDMVSKAMLAKFDQVVGSISVQDGLVQVCWYSQDGREYETFDIDEIVRLQ